MYFHFHGRQGGHDRMDHERRGGGRMGGWGRGPFGFGFDVGDGERGGRARRMFDGGELRLVLLKLIADEPRHGYELIRAIEELSGGAYAPSPGVVYPGLTMLDEMALIEEQASDGARKRFAATDAGRAHLAEHAEQVEALIARLAALAARPAHGDQAPVRRAIGSLHHAVRHRIARGDLSPDALHDIAALIDDVTQKIERLK